MKRLLYLIPLSAVTVLLFVSAAMGQSTPNQYGSDTDQNVSVVNYRQEMVNIRPSGFYRAHLPVEPGTTVVWLNLDSKAHTVTADDGSFDSGPIAPGESFSFRFDEPGKWWYHSQTDPTNMTGSIIVGEDNGSA